MPLSLSVSYLLRYLDHCYTCSTTRLNVAMEFRKLLTITIVPSVLFFLLSVVSLALTTHYWIIGDWITPRGVKVQTGTFNDRTQSYTIDETIVYFTENDTDATIVSGCLCLTAAVVALIAWVQLRKPGMDTFDATVCAKLRP